jgi:hypothetical protein
MPFFRFIARLALLTPFGLLARSKPRHYREMLRVVWEAERFRVLLIGFARSGGFTAYAGRFRLQGLLP